MDRDVRELIAAMCARAGMIMEDASLLAVTISRHNDEVMRDALARLAASVEASHSLIAAATLLQDVAE